MTNEGSSPKLENGSFYKKTEGIFEISVQFLLNKKFLAKIKSANFVTQCNLLTRMAFQDTFDKIISTFIILCRLKLPYLLKKLIHMTEKTLCRKSYRYLRFSGKIAKVMADIFVQQKCDSDKFRFSNIENAKVLQNCYNTITRVKHTLNYIF